MKAQVRAALPAAALVALIASPVQADLRYMQPRVPLAPTDREQCDDFKRPYDDLAKQLSARHNPCLDQYRDSGMDSGGGPCFIKACEPYHTPSYQPWYKAAERSFLQCLEQVRVAQEQERERKAELERQQQAYMDYQRNQVEAQGKWQRDAQQNAYNAAQDKANRERALLENKAGAANSRADFFGSAASRNQALLGSGAGGSPSVGTQSVNDALGGGLGSTLAAVRNMLSSSSNSTSSSGGGSSPDVLARVPGSSNLERASLVSEYLLNWPGTAALTSRAAGIVSIAERAQDGWNAWSAFRSGDTLSGVGSTASMAADELLPSYAAFFAVPALNAVTAGSQSALQDLDHAFHEFDQVSATGQPYVSPPTGQGRDFHNVQQAYVESMCDYCRWDEDEKVYKLTVYDELVEVNQDGEISTGWESIRQVIGER